MRSLSGDEAASLAQSGRRFLPVGHPVRATQLAENRAWLSGSGDVLVAHAGDWLVSNGTEEWAVEDAIFTDTYSPLEDGTFRKTAGVRAIQMTENFEVPTLEGAATGQAGDWLVVGDNDDVWPVTDDVFMKRYIVDEGE